jgi:tetratricopeptide (TPR) repeat protein
VGRSRFLTLLILAGCAFAQDPAKAPTPPPAAAKQDPVEEPPEEDEALKPKEYSFNPLEAQRDVRTGDYYFRKGNFKAAAKRFEEATLYDPANADAFLRLGEAREKLHDKKGAKAAYAKYLELKPDSKLAGSLKKKI